jgi:hypothetical protein
MVENREEVKPLYIDRWQGKQELQQPSCGTGPTAMAMDISG